MCYIAVGDDGANLHYVPMKFRSYDVCDHALRYVPGYMKRGIGVEHKLMEPVRRMYDQLMCDR